MKVVIAIDSLKKGSLSSMDAGHAIKEGILKATDADVIIKPLADGGEGTTDALIEGMGGEKISLTVKGPLQTPVEAYYGYLQESNTAIMEMAMASGITLIPREALDPLNTTTYGVGEMIKDAVHRGIRNFIIGIGGSATNDGGTGMLSALGYEFLIPMDNRLALVDNALKKLQPFPIRINWPIWRNATSKLPAMWKIHCAAQRELPISMALKRRCKYIAAASRRRNEKLRTNRGSLHRQTDHGNGRRRSSGRTWFRLCHLLKR